MRRTPLPHRSGRRPWRALVLAGVAAVLAVGCAAGSDASAPSPTTTGTSTAGSTGTATTGAATTGTVAAPSAGCAARPSDLAVRSTHERVDLPVGGTGRWYDRYVPAGYDGKPTALVVDLHGYLSGAAGETAMSGFAPIAEREGFVIATPQGNSDKAYWNAVPHPELPDDLAFLERVIDDVERVVCVDPARVYVVGFSNGAFMASLVACRLSGRVAAVAAVAGLQRPKDCDPERPVPVLGIHGTADGYVGVNGPPNPRLADLAWNDESRAAFDGLPFAPVTTSAAGWAAADGCATEPTRTSVATGIERTEYTDCRDGSTVELYVVDGGGHTWPGSAFSTASASILGPTTHELDASEVIWSFFRDHPRR